MVASSTSASILASMFSVDVQTVQSRIAGCGCSGKIESLQLGLVDAQYGRGRTRGTTGMSGVVEVPLPSRYLG